MSDTLDLLKALIERPSITPNDHGCQELLCDRLSQIGFKIERFDINQTSNFWAIYGDENPVLCFAGHTDVVPPGDTGWVSPPFEPTIRDGILYGRGAADMKSGVAAMITATERFLKTKPTLKGSIAFLITSDEEATGTDGTKAVIKKLSERNAIPKYCLVGEASSVKQLGDTIKIGRRGSLTGKLLIKGIQGHVAYPHLGKNPIHLALAPLQEITHLTWEETLAPFPNTTLQIANIQSGTGASNVIPGLLTADFNLRFSPNYQVEDLQQRIEAILKAHELDYEITWTYGSKPFLTDPKSPLIQTVIETISAHCGIEASPETTGGTSDGRFFAEYGSDVVELGPINASIHQVNEHIGVEELDKLSLLYEKILAGVLGKSAT